MESKFRKYRKFHKKHFKGRKKDHKPRYSIDRNGERKSSATDLKDVECFECRKKRHYKSEYPELTQEERKELRAKRDRWHSKKKAMVAENAGSSEYASESSAFNSNGSYDESQALMAKDTENMAESSSNNYDNGMNGTEGFKRLKRQQLEVRGGSLTSSDCPIADDQSHHSVMSSTESKEATVSSKLATGSIFPKIKFKKMPNEITGKHGEVKIDQRHRHESRENLKHRRHKAKSSDSFRW